MPRPRVLGVAFLGFVLYAYGSTSEVAWLFLLAYWLWALVLGAFLYAAWNRRRLEASAALRAGEPGPGSPRATLPDAVLRTGPAESIFEGDRAHLALTLRSRSGVRGPARVVGRVAGLVGERGVEEERDLERLPRGVLRAEGLILESGDPAGLFVHRRALPGRELGLVLPRFASLAASRRQREVEAAPPAPRAGSGNEIFGVREYVRGDPLRRIHWRTSARRGELVVREFEPPGQRSLTLVLDARPPSPEAADQLARLAASEAWDCLREGGRVALWAPGLEASSPAEARSLWALLEWLARYPELPAADTAPPPAGEVLAITAAGGAEVEDALAELRRRGAEARAWLVGGAELEAELGAPARRVGLEWPLSD
ncbi:MAG: DUF58 domain-containing protein [Chloroflexota bacterium]